MSKMAVLRMIQMETENVQIGDKILVPLTGFGEFFATAHKITNEGVLFVFDDYVTVRPMNKTNTNKGGFENSDLKKWMDTVLLEAFPDQLRDRISKLTIPTVESRILIINPNGDGFKMQQNIMFLRLVSPL